MPTIKTREYSLFEPGCLVMCAKDLYSSSPIDGDGGNENRIPHGTVGMILRGPSEERSAQYQVQFLKDIVWWVNSAEIEPWLG